MWQGDGLAAHERIRQHAQRTAQQHIEVDFEWRQLNLAAIHHHNIHRIRQGRKQHQHHSDPWQDNLAVAPIEQRHTEKRQCYRHPRHPVQPLVEEERHDDGRHNRIGEKNGGRHTGVHHSKA